jgi:proline racemase
MRWSRTLTMVDAHAEGEVGRVVTGGILGVQGESMLDRLRWFNTHGHALRRWLTHEPRGCAQMSTNLLFAPTRPDADAAYLILQGDRAHAMSGSNSICVVTVLLETGIVPMVEPETVVRLDTPAGLVTARATCRDGKCERVTLDMTPAFAHRLDAVYAVPGMGEVTVDIAFGGVFYALIDPTPLGLTIAPAQARKLVEAGMAVQRAVAAGPRIAHPEIAGIEGVSYVMFVDRTEEGHLLGTTVLPPGRLDRSPCGTGNAARLSVAAARGQVAPGERFAAQSIIGSRFDVAHAGNTEVAGQPAVRTTISGRGWIHGTTTLGLDPSDPWPEGFVLADCWGDALDLLA